MAAGAGSRIGSIDRLRGLVMLLMLVDHTREFFYLGHQVGDPIDLSVTSPALAATRLTAHLCAPVFVVLTGIAAWLYGAGKPIAATSAFLLKRGMFLVILELTVVNFAWTFAFPPATLFLQVIWAIGLSMIALAGLVHLPRGWIAAVGIAIVAGHNLLDDVAVAAGSPFHAIWAIVHERGYIALADGVRARTSYPVLPWIGAIALGYAAGSWWDAGVPADRRRRLLAATGAAMVCAFVALRATDLYGDPVAWTRHPDALQSILAFLNLTKYPPSLDFLLVTLGLGALLLAAWDGRPGGSLAVLGGAPLFFYILHLYALHLLHLAAAAWSGRPDYEVPSVGWLWLVAASMSWPLWRATKQFGKFKRTSRTWWIRYL